MLNFQNKALFNVPPPNFSEKGLFENWCKYIPKLQNNVYFGILFNVPPFWQNEKFLGLGNPVKESGTPAYLRS